MGNSADTSGYSEEERQLWKRLQECQGARFSTAKGLQFSFTIKGNELFADRKEKSITRATVNKAYRRAKELGGIVPGPKTLGTFGASYLYPVFIYLGVIDKKKE